MRWLLVLLAACGMSARGAAPSDSPVADSAPEAADASMPDTDVFSPAIANVIVEIDYEHGEAPYTGPVIALGDTFDLTVNNLNRLFAGKKALAVPRTLAEMQDVGAIEDEELTVADILALANAHRDQHDTADTKTYYVIFVSGHYADENGANSQVLGVEVGTTGVVAMFKDVIASSTGSVVPNIGRYIEQSTLTHELAHGIGLVDNGVPMVADHRDAPHGAHCTDSHCIMYWANDGLNGGLQFAEQNIPGGDTILFDAACLTDVDARN
jgi:hypothetical protein